MDMYVYIGESIMSAMVYRGDCSTTLYQIHVFDIRLVKIIEEETIPLLVTQHKSKPLLRKEVTQQQ